MAEEEVAAEMEAVQAVYGDDCQVVEAYPPHLHVHLKPRTADVSSQQVSPFFWVAKLLFQKLLSLIALCTPGP